MKQPQHSWERFVIHKGIWIVSGLLLLCLFSLIIYTITFGGKHQSEKESFQNFFIGNRVATECKNTMQGSTYITDDRGFICHRYNLLENGCCDPSLSDSISCKKCNTSSMCCTNYEFCVSCCMNQHNADSIDEVKDSTSDPILKSSDSNFDFCRAICRTNSKSLVENTYRSDWKFCYSTKLPPSYDETLQYLSSPPLTRENSSVDEEGRVLLTKDEIKDSLENVTKLVSPEDNNYGLGDEEGDTENSVSTAGNSMRSARRGLTNFVILCICIYVVLFFFNL
eukprot:TRINITY_DN7458_c0_g1_i1.p1 TRINITY_DN7458_c0_g1~~TRINITY_DN7458_c0_g1_i1.p1  ORF type:complete len:281 (-),score=32.21 TRINITY_DN7458_c0_g1_i1:2-844(-)